MNLVAIIKYKYLLNARTKLLPLSPRVHFLIMSYLLDFLIHLQHSSEQCWKFFLTWSMTVCKFVWIILHHVGMGLMKHCTSLKMYLIFVSNPASSSALKKICVDFFIWILYFYDYHFPKLIDYLKLGHYMGGLVSI